MLLTRLPLSIATSFDLHVLGVPPAYILSHDQTLKFNNGVHKLCVLNTLLVQITICISLLLSVYDKFFW